MQQTPAKKSLRARDLSPQDPTFGFSKLTPKLSYKLDIIAEALESKGFVKEAMELDRISNYLDRIAAEPETLQGQPTTGVAPAAPAAPAQAQTASNQDIQNQLNLLKTNLTKIEDLWKKIGLPEDPNESRDPVKVIRKWIGAVIKSVDEVSAILAGPRWSDKELILDRSLSTRHGFSRLLEFLNKYENDTQISRRRPSQELNNAKTAVNALIEEYNKLITMQDPNPRWLQAIKLEPWQ